MFNLFTKPKLPDPPHIFPTGLGRLEEILAGKMKGIPTGEILKLAKDYPFNLKLVRQRNSKTGDFRGPHNGNAARITLNSDLNPYAFLITLMHELAHHLVEHQWQAARKLQQRKRRPKPHGPEWKSAFGSLMKPYMVPHIIPPEILFPLARYLGNPKASTSADAALIKALHNFEGDPSTIHLEELPYNALFSIRNGMTFRKKERLRTRYSCIHIPSGRIYRVSPHAEVIPAADENPAL